MKTKKNQNTIRTLKLIALLPVIFLVLVAISSCAARKKVVSVNTEIAPLPPPPPIPPPPPPATKAAESKVVTVPEIQESVDGEIPFVVVEEMPMFPGGDEALLKYIVENVKYPEAAKNQKIQGRVIVRFCVTAKGGVDLISVLKSAAPDLDAEAIRVVQTLPAFKPGRQGGKDVPVWYMVPVIFALN
jgi:TonB family protein